MLALLVRGFFLLTVVGWYSTSLWKMIDGYFKGQFQRYLEEEYQRNPKMREDVRSYNGPADKSTSPLTEELQQVLRSYSAELAEEAVGEADLARIRTEESGTPSTPAADAFAAGATAEIEKEEAIVAEAEKEVDGLEEPAFREKPARERDAEPPDDEAVILTDTIENESADVSMVYIEELEPRQQQPDLRKDQQRLQQQQHLEQQHQSEQRNQQRKKGQHPPKLGKKRKLSGRPEIGAKSERAFGKQNRHESLTLTDENFEYVSRKRYMDVEGNIVDRDFSEFDDDNSWTSDDEDGEDRRHGIPLADLPYKPAVDLYDLDRLSEEEFCPLTLDDDPTCEETRSWP